MRWVRVLLATAVSVAFTATAGVATAAIFDDAFSGIQTAFVEVSPGVEVSTFAGLAVGDLPGRFTASVTHGPLAAGGAILDDGADGDFELVNRLRRIHVTGEFTGGAVALLSREPGCGEEVYAVDAGLDVRLGARAGTAHVDALLTHFRARIFGTCVTYFATVEGSLQLDA